MFYKASLYAHQILIENTKKTPKNVKSLTVSIVFWSIIIVKPLISFLLIEKHIETVLEEFRVKQLFCNHCETPIISLY